MKNVYEAPVLVFSILKLADVLTASGFTEKEEDEGDHIGIEDLKL